LAMGIQRLANDARDGTTRGRAPAEQPHMNDVDGAGTDEEFEEDDDDRDGRMDGTHGGGGGCGGDDFAYLLAELADELSALVNQAYAFDDNRADDDAAREAHDALDDMMRQVSNMQRDRIGGVPTSEQVELCRERIARHLDKLAAEVRAKGLAAWAAWLRDGIDAGARNAHKYLRIPSEWRPEAVRTPDGIISANPAAVIASYRDKYVRRWNSSGDASAHDRPRNKPPWEQAPRCALPRTCAEQLRAASREFAKDTATTFDGLAMRHYSLVTDAGLEVLADVVLAMELIGRLPPQLDALVMPLIGKERGGHRAITMATSLYRLWGRVRREVTQRWEASHDRPYFAAGKGRRIQDVVWRQLFKAEAGEGDGLASASVLWDMKTFYDSLNRMRLWTQVRRHDFPLAIARLAFSVYDSPRMLTMNGRVACPAYARDGVPAGCMFANAFTRLYCIEPFDGLVADIGQHYDDDADFDAYVDDLALTITAPPQLDCQHRGGCCQVAPGQG
jgi:hypothetical protein